MNKLYIPLYLYFLYSDESKTNLQIKYGHAIKMINWAYATMSFSHPKYIE